MGLRQAIFAALCLHFEPAALLQSQLPRIGAVFATQKGHELDAQRLEERVLARKTKIHGRPFRVLDCILKGGEPYTNSSSGAAASGSEWQ